MLGCCWVAVVQQARATEPSTPDPLADIPAVPRFGIEVQAVFTKAGCNLGACHGNQNGKGGFKLSLRGQDPAADALASAREFAGRRVNLFAPEESLLLLKPSMGVAHEGGMKLKHGSPDYEVVRRWIAAGGPLDPPDMPRVRSLAATPRETILTEPDRAVQLRVEAELTDGTRRDVSRWACYDPADPLVTISPAGLVTFNQPGETVILVRYLDAQQPVRVANIATRPDFAWSDPPENNLIDRQIHARLKALRMNPSEPATDAEFVRRITLDLLGILPSVEEAKAFVNDPAPDKRARLIDALFQRPEFAEFWALKWADLLRVEEKVIDAKGVRATYEYLRAGMAANKSLDQLSRELVATTGSTYDRPAANYYRALRDPISRSEATAQVFLGVRLQCAKCHNHPFDRWTQDDYYRWTAVFARIDYQILENRRRDDNDKHEFIGEQLVVAKNDGEMTDPRTNKPAPPRLLGAGNELPPDAQRLDELARWLTAPDNRQFARATVNRVWHQMYGRGLVEPVDDFRLANPATHPELLEELTDGFIAGGYDLRQLLKLIATSRTYQRGGQPNETNAADETHYARTLPRRLGAEPLLDAICQVTGAQLDMAGLPEGLRAAQRPGVGAKRKRGGGDSDADKFLRTFGKPVRLTNCECERSTAGTIGQSLQLLSGPLLQELLAQKENNLARWAADPRVAEETIDEIWWTALTRSPTPMERAKVLELWNGSTDRHKLLEDVIWALVNSREFWFRR